MKKAFGIFTVIHILTYATNGLSEDSNLPHAPITIIITDTQSPDAITNTSLSMSVINAKQIEHQTPNNLLQAIDNLPGLYAEQIGGHGGIGSIFIRGGDPNFTVVQIDGVKQNDPNNQRGGSFDLSTIDPSNIERVEIIRGPLSAFYGSDTLSGIINVHTKRASTEFNNTLELKTGSNQYKGLNLGSSGPLGTHFYAINAGYLDEGNQIEGDSFTRRHVNATFETTPSKNASLYLNISARDNEATGFPIDSGGPTFAEIRETDQREQSQLGFVIKYSQNSSSEKNFSSKFTYASFDELLDSPGIAAGIRDPFGIPASTTKSKLDRTQLTLIKTLAVESKLLVSLGADLIHERGTSTGELEAFGAAIPTAYDLSRNTFGVVSGFKYMPRNYFIIEGSLRIDDPTDFNVKTSPSIGALYTSPTKSTNFRVNYSHGFKLPSFFALGNPIVGNPNLNPEKSKSIEARLTHKSYNGLELDLALFKNIYKDLVDFEAGPPPQLVNRSKVTAKGLELSVNKQYTDHLLLNGHFSYIPTNIVGTDESLLHRPKLRGGIKVDWSFAPNRNAYANLVYVGERLDSSIPTGEIILPSYWRLDTTVSWILKNNYRISFSLDNTFDAHYQTAIGFPAPERRLRVAVRLNL